MFNISDYPEIILHIKTIAGRVYGINTGGWHECFCPYCDDATRYFNPKHGHFKIASSFPYGHCFRCGKKVSLYKFLIDTKFTNHNLLKRLHKLSQFAYGGSTKQNASFNRSDIKSIDETLIKMHNIYTNAQKQFPAEYVKFKQYVTGRCLDINPINFLITPNIYVGENKTSVSVAFSNFDGQQITSRSIDGDASRYFKNKGKKQFYFFQNINDIDLYKTIVICEGAFDLINLYNYYAQFKDAFFIAIGDSNYKGLLNNLINTFLLIGEYDIKIVFDKGVRRLQQLKYTLITNTNILNPQIGIEMFEPTHGKDVSELMMLTQIE